jgi:uncharacterized membrane protein (UPF0127 family)
MPRLKGLPDGAGLILEPCNGVVSFFMRFRIDALFITHDGAVCHQVRDMAPWRASKILRRARLVVELPAGTLAATGTDLGDQITIAAR